MGQDENFSNNEDRLFGIRTEILAAIAGITASSATYWLQLRKNFYNAMKPTHLYDKIKKVRDEALSALSPDSPTFRQDHIQITKQYSADIDIAHEGIGIGKINGLWKKLPHLSKASRLELAEKTLTFGFMAATITVGLGIVAKIAHVPKRLLPQDKTQEESTTAALCRTALPKGKFAQSVTSQPLSLDSPGRS